MKTKTIAAITSPGTPHFVGDGFRVHNFIPASQTMQRMDPFILLDYNSKYSFPPSEIPRGVGVHPHKGFETVTIAYKGRIEHGDSSGGGGIIGEGDVQWMTAASGVLHKEFHETQWSKNGGEFQMIQLWVNLPSKEKKGPAKYQAISKEAIKMVELSENRGSVRIIAGDYENQTGPASTFTPIHLYNVELKAGAKLKLNFPSSYTTALVAIEGNSKLNDSEFAQDHFALMANDGEEFSLEAVTHTLVLVMSGEPIKEPIAAQGPFVMNTHAELIQAFEEFNTGKFGHL